MKCDEFDKSLVDGFTAVSVLLAAITVLFGVRYPEVTQILGKSVPGSGEGALDERKAYRKDLGDALAKLTPLLILFWAFAALPFPSTFQIIQSIDFVPAHYDFIRSAWAVTEAMMLYFAGWSTRLAFRLWRAVREAPPS